MDLAKGPFDYIHVRDMYGSIDDWSVLYKKIFHHLKPRGWFEDQEFDIRTHTDVEEIANDPNHVFNRWNQIFLDAGERMGKTLKIGIGSRMGDTMAKAGFVDGVERKFRLPMGACCRDPTLKQIGFLVLHFVEEGLEGFSLLILTQVLGWRYEECQLLISQMQQALRDQRSHPYFEVLVE
ncbi:unnamed protein product [Parascedosporium putredinis]|uniref:Methyltransferase n=1 Tax=Parascedosporium putredinis TaxID=1442378 RepID=A0A9P1H930_9PEZI|nr:unnamed protein product [Parascedosporium putredinis]CAI8000534.1 unnamed protein product [Parascedosporium putredinis]